MTNPFLHRATEFIRNDSAFLAIVSPEPLTTFVANHPKKSLLFDRPVRVIGSPGSGKTMMASLVEFRLVETILRDQSSISNRALGGALAASGFTDGRKPLVAAIRLPMESEYRDFWELPYEPQVKTRLVLSLVQARAVLKLVQNLTANRTRSPAEIRFVVRDDAAAQLSLIGGDQAESIVARALEVERAVYGIGAGLLPPQLEDIPSAAREPYQPFEALGHLEIDWKDEPIELKPLIILDDVHALHPDQFDGLFRTLARREVRVGRWMMMRMDALSPKAVFRFTTEESLPGLKPERDYLDIFMQSESGRDTDRRRFRKMATDMANRYLQLVEPLRDRNFTEFTSLLSEETPVLTDGHRAELRELLDKDQHKLTVGQDRRAKIEEVVQRYVKGAKSIDVEEDVQLAMIRVLMHRYAKRIAFQPSLFSGEDDPEPNQKLKAKSGVAEAARLFLHDKFTRPLHYGLDVVCDASNENAELFLQLAGALVDRMETRAIRNQDPALSPTDQQSVLREKAKAIVDNWSFPYARKVMALVDHIAKRCHEVSLLPNARLGAGANAVGILEEQIEAQLEIGGELAEVLKFAIAYSSLIAVRNYGQGGKTWCLLELPGPICLRDGLTLKRGGFLEWHIDKLAEIIDRI